MDWKLYWSILIAVLLASCSSPSEVEEDVGISEQTTTTVSAGAGSMEEIERRVAAGFKPVEFKDEQERDGATRDFNYSWPAQVSAVPELAALFQQRREAALVEQKNEWEAALQEFPGDECIACKNRGYGKNWEVVADLERFLSLSADQYVYTGGAHGNSWFDALVWDRAAKEALAPQAMFSSITELGEAVREPYCAALDEERQARREDAGVSGIFDGCPELADLTLLLGSSTGEKFDRIGLLAAPYIAGPYAEGSYEVTLPVTEAVLASVKPEYRSAFEVQ